MASTTKPSTTERRDSSSRGLKQRMAPFIGLFLLPLPAHLLGLLIHVLVAEDTAALALATGGISVITCILTIVAFLIGRHRDQVIRWMVVSTVAVTGLSEAVTVAIGYHKYWAIAFVITGEGLAAAWCLTRIDSLRKDPKGEQTEDPITKKLGLENTGFGKPKHFTDDDGEVTRIEVPVRHGPGETAEVIQHAVPGIESVADAPRGRSRAVPGEGAGRSMLVIITKDVLKGLIPYPGPSSPGGCITEPLITAQGEDQQIGKRYIAGGSDEAPNPSGTGWMGMTRTGKTLNAQMGGLEIISRRNVQMMWFDTIKGAQTVRPMRRGLDIIVASDDPKEFRKGMKALQELIKWRANELGKYGYRTWTAQAAADPLLKMPLLVPHFEECDALTEIAPEEMVFLASKGLSAGVSCGFSLQRADATSMPTGLRYNVGNWYCFGTGDSYSAGFALSDQTIDAGAHPEHWKQSKPGYHYFEGIGVDEQRWPVTHKSFFATDEGMEAHCEVWGPRMQPLEPGAPVAMGDWYARAKAETERLVAEWDAGPMAAPVVHDGVAAALPVPVSPGPVGPLASEDTDGDDSFDRTVAEVDEEFEQIGAELMESEAYSVVDPESLRHDPSQPTPALPPGGGLSWRDSKDEAPTREDAVEALTRALQEIAADPTSDAEEDEDDEWIRRQSDGAALFTIGALVKRYRFRSRPWFHEMLTALAAGEMTLPGLVLEAGGTPGEYRLQRVAEPANSDYGR